MIELVVTSAFGEYGVGDVITDKKAIELALAENATNVVKRKAAAPAVKDK